MILKDAYIKIARRTGLDEDQTADKSKMLDAMTQALKKIYRKNRLIAVKCTGVSFDTVADTYFYYLDSRILYGMDFKSDADSDVQLDIWNEERFNRENPVPDTSDTGEPTTIVPLQKIWVSAQPTSASAIAFVSSSSADTGVVRVRGIVSGVEVVESVTLTGVTAANTTNSFTSLISITKDATTGTITATSNSAAVTNISLLPSETDKEQWKVRLHKVPDDAYTVTYSFYRKPWVFSENEDLIPFEESFEDIFITLSTALVQKINKDKDWKVTYQLASDMAEKLDDEDYFSTDTDARMGLIEVQDDYGDDW